MNVFERFLNFRVNFFLNELASYKKFTRDGRDGKQSVQPEKINAFLTGGGDNIFCPMSDIAPRMRKKLLILMQNVCKVICNLFVAAEVHVVITFVCTMFVRTT